MDDNDIRELARKQAGPFLREVSDDPLVGWVRFKRWNHRVDLAYAEIRRKEGLQKE